MYVPQEDYVPIKLDTHLAGAERLAARSGRSVRNNNQTMIKTIQTNQ